MLDTGEASVTVTLSYGVVTVTCGDVKLLRGYAPPGTWDALCKFLRDSLEEPKGPLGA